MQNAPFYIILDGLKYWRIIIDAFMCKQHFIAIVGANVRVFIYHCVVSSIIMYLLIICSVWKMSVFTVET